MRGRILCLWQLLAVAALSIPQVRAAAGETVPEYRVKAAFLYKFATYIRWPASSTAEDPAPFVIGVIGRDPFGSTLTEVVRNQTVRGRVVHARSLHRMEEALECDLVFISSSEKGNLKQILALLRGTPVVTVGDMDRFAEQGGMIGLVTTNDHRIRFNINKAAIERAGLRASSQLLSLATIVEEAHADGGHR